MQCRTIKMSDSGASRRNVVDVCLCEHKRVFTCVHTSPHLHLRVYLFRCINMYLRLMHMHIHIHAHRPMHIHMHIHILTHIHIRIHIQIHIQIHEHIHVHAHMNTQSIRNAVNIISSRAAANILTSINYKRRPV